MEKVRMMRRRIIGFALIGLTFLGGSWLSAADDEKAVPQGIIIGPSPSGLSIQLKTEYLVYSPKEALKLSIELSRDAYVYLYDINPAGQVTLLFPNGFSRNNLVKAGKYTLPDNPSYSFVVTEPMGLESLQALAFTKSVPLLELSAQGDLDQHPFPMLSSDAKALKPQVQKMIEITVEPGEWAADWTQFLIAPAVARLQIVSQPAGADVYLNGELRGQSPLELEVEPGQVRISLVKEGYQQWSRTLTLANRASNELNISLEPALPPLYPPVPQAPKDDKSLWIPTFSLGFNAGLNAKGIFSAGFEIGATSGLSVGGSISFTDDEVPKYFDVGHPQPFPRERVYHQGSETEAYLKLSLPLFGALAIQIGGGIAVQEQVHIAAPGGVSMDHGPGMDPLVEILPNGYSETASYLTAFGGVALRVGEGFLSIGHHTRRGWVLGLTLNF